jgi:Fur family ferric uptake transcriptional regulator
MDLQTDSILKFNQLSGTGTRKIILDLFLKSGGALSHGDIEKKAGQKFDRVTIYRTLQTFLDKGIIHSIPSADNSIRYALCKDKCSGGQHHDNHVHFVCSHCGRTVCLDDILIPEVRLPKGFRADQVEMLVNGVCGDCRENTKQKAPM